MEPTLTFTDELDSGPDEKLLVRAWRTEQLGRLGLSRILAETFADLVDLHALAELVERGCSPELALEIVR
jgi:class 3 adenylate cyclase